MAQTVSAATPLWTAVLPRPLLADEDILVSEPADGARRVAPQVRPREIGARESLPIGENLLGYARPRVFGTEERCSVTRGAAALRIDCRAGDNPAGVSFAFGVAPPSGASLWLAVAATGSGFRGGLALDGGSPAGLRPLGLRTEFELPTDVATVDLVALAPPTGGSLILGDLRLQPAGPARKAGIAVDAVEGDPDMVTPAGRTAAIAHAAALADYQRAASPGERLSGLQLDIEPYVRPGWRGTAATFGAWQAAVMGISAAYGAPVDLVLPFWIADDVEGALFLNKTSASLRQITAMAYRSNAAAIAATASRLLAWGAARSIPVRIALENGLIGDETEQRFVRSATGTLAVAQDGVTATVFDTTSVVSDATMFAGGRRSMIRGATLSFQGDEARMMSSARELEPLFSAWPSFSGYGLHGLEWENEGND